MAAATVDHHHQHHHNRLHLNSLPLIDVRLLSHSELLSLSLCSSSSTTSASTIPYDDDDRDSTPKIDASVFNESAGSRKQTFSRLRLAPRNSSSLRPQIPPPPAAVKPLDEENSQVISLLKSLLNIHSYSSTAITIDADADADEDRLIPVPVEFEESPNATGNGYIGPHNIPVELVTCSETKRKRGRPRRDDNGSSRWVISSETTGVHENQREVDKTMSTSSIHGDSQNITGKRKRGRPRKIKSENENVNVIVNENCFDKVLVTPVENSVSCGTGKRKRGRPRKIESGVRIIDRMEITGVSESSQNMSSGGVTCETRKRKRGRPRKDESMRRGFGGVRNEEIVVGGGEGEDEKGRAMENRNGVVVNVVPLGNVVDPFCWDQLRRTTEEGMEKESELLGFWRGSNGEW